MVANGHAISHTREAILVFHISSGNRKKLGMRLYVLYVCTHFFNSFLSSFSLCPHSPMGFLRLSLPRIARLLSLLPGFVPLGQVGLCLSQFFSQSSCLLIRACRSLELGGGGGGGGYIMTGKNVSTIPTIQSILSNSTLKQQDALTIE